MRRPTDPPLTSRLPRLWLAPVFALIALGSLAGRSESDEQAENPAEPAPREGAWMKLHESYLELAGRGKIDLLFLGDSITFGWNQHDAEGRGPSQVWDRYYGPRNAANFGIGGDRTQHVLWRVGHGEVDGLAPRVVVLMIGTNNILSDTPERIAEGVAAVVSKLREKLPKARVLMLGILPRGKAPDVIRDQIAAVNAHLARFDDGRSIRYLDIGRHFLEPDGTISPEVMPDFIHLSRKGYLLWADAMEPTLREMLEGSN